CLRHSFLPVPPPPATSTLSLHDALPICLSRVATQSMGIRCYQASLPPTIVASASRTCGEIASFRKRTDPSTMAALQPVDAPRLRSEEHTSELQSLTNLVCRLLLEKKNNT